MKSTIDCVDSAWVTFLGTSLPCPATVGPYAVWPSRSRRSMTGRHREPSWQPPCTSTKVYEFSVADCGSSTLTTVSFTSRYDTISLPQRVTIRRRAGPDGDAYEPQAAEVYPRTPALPSHIIALAIRFRER